MEVLEGLSGAAARKARRRRRLLGGLVILALAGALLVARARQVGDGEDAAVARGTAALALALTDDDAEGFVRAEGELLRAAKGVVFDAYPIFVLEVARRLQRGDWSGVPSEQREVFESLRSGALGRGVTQAMALPEGPAARRLRRLTVQLDLAHRWVLGGGARP